jgi:large subunit ribosomal protein L15
MAHDFNLHAPAGANKQKKVLGRGQGSGRGTTSGKGHKGQKARSGGKTYVGFEGGQMPLYRRLARRGFSNYPFKMEWQIVNLSQIEKCYEAGENVDFASLCKKRLVRGTAPVKILSNGDLSKKLSFKVDAVSAAAKEKIEKAGGDITIMVVAASSSDKTRRNNKSKKAANAGGK